MDSGTAWSVECRETVAADAASAALLGAFSSAGDYCLCLVM
jgi:hypothetical protein